MRQKNHFNHTGRVFGRDIQFDVIKNHVPEKGHHLKYTSNKYIIERFVSKLKKKSEFFFVLVLTDLSVVFEDFLNLTPRPLDLLFPAAPSRSSPSPLGCSRPKLG